MHYYPPCISQIRMLHDLGYDVEVLYGTSNDTALELLEREGIRCNKIANIADINTGLIEKAWSWYNFRKGLLHALKQYEKTTTLLWFGTAETAMPMKGALKGWNYVLSLLELIDDNPQKRILLKSIAKRAKAITVCEETRGYIMRYWWNLSRIPYVFPNKPYKQSREKRILPSTPETTSIVNIIRNQKVIIYQGIIQNSEELVEIAKALKTINKDYLLLLMGIDKYNSVKKIKEIYDDVVFVSYIPAPNHLEITSYAHIGITYYRNDSLNKVFCAPNKIYEYTGFGIPIIANDVPGLKNTVGAAGAAKCIKITEEEVIKAIGDIESNYEAYSQNALSFFSETDNYKTMDRLMNDIEQMEQGCAHTVAT